jgi:lactocepin
MKNKPLYRRLLSVLLVVAMLSSFMVPYVSADSAKRVNENLVELKLSPVEAGTLASQKLNKAPETADVEAEHAPGEMVRVSIVLDKASTVDAGYELENIGTNPAAVSYRDSLKAEQAEMTAKIEKVLGSKLDVKWNLTLAANIISANVAYGRLDDIRAIPGVKEVFLENRYEPQTDVEADEPNNGTASGMIGSNLVWGTGYYGAGSKVAVIDTGIDKDHLSFDGEALEYALAQTAAEKGMSYDEYVATLDLLTAEKIDAVKDQLNAQTTGAQAHFSTKIGFGYNYVDKSATYITHMEDSQGEHGSHVEGISAANRFVKVGDEFKPALEAVGTQGVAPDAQIVTMKVFGKGGGAYDSDYMVAIEDAIILGCDSANLSLGSGAAGFGFSSGYEAVMNKLVENGMVCSISMGNSGFWYDTPKNTSMYPYLYIDDNNYVTGGSPGSYTNSLTVASVDNAGQTGSPLIFGDRHVFYSETSGYGNEPIATIAGPEYDFVLVDGPGVDDNEHVGQEGDQFLALGSEVLTGKIAMCYRGTSSFFAKANAAVAQGAAGVIIINNTTGVINMNLTGYNYTAPAVSITKADGDAIKAEAEPILDDEGNVLYYTGKMSISTEMELNMGELSDTVTVSSFSSYGVPGTLVMKPEILAPGGSIYSVWGANTGSSAQSAHDQYELMSGTSMAAPQVNGMAGLLGQYIRENDLCAKTGMTQRQLINSLLMSTAHPVYDADGNYWPVIRVGAGLAHVDDAINAKSIITVDEGSTMFPDTAKDGKVKIELGDDPEKKGEYEYSFTVMPLEDSKEFRLRTDTFIQWIAGNAGYGMLQDTATTLIGSKAVYEVNGETYEDAYLIDADVNMDGKTNAADAQAILNHIAGAEEEGDKFDAAAADVNGDGKITSYDAKLLLENAATPTVTITEPTKVTVKLTLDPDDVAFLNNYFTKGFYVQGYTYVEPVADAEGAMDVVHSIPILGYYGSWTDPAMLDRTSVIDEAYGTGKLPYIGNPNINYLTMKNADGDSFIYMGNPYVIEDEFPVERLAMNSEDTIAAYNYLNIRNLANLGFAVQDENGKVLLSQITPSQKYGAYYYVNGGTWQNTSPANYNVGKKLAAAGVKEDDVVTVGFYALPEYYGILAAKLNGEVATSGFLTDDGFRAVLENGLVGDGAGIKYTVKIDNTVPEVQGAFMDLVTGNITVKAADNNYIAYVAVTNKSGTETYAGVVPEQSAPGETVEVPVVFEEGVKIPNEVVLVVGDYAGNEAAFKVTLGGSGEDESANNAGTMIGFVTDKTTVEPGEGNRAWKIDPDTLSYAYEMYIDWNTFTVIEDFTTHTGLDLFANTNFSVVAAEYADGYVFMAADDGWFYVSKFDEMEDAQRVGRYDDVTGTIYDLAFNSSNRKLYAMGEDNTVYRLDPVTGELTAVAVVTLPGADKPANRLAIDDHGVYYTANEGGANAKLYKFELEGEAFEPVNPDEPVEGETAYAWDFETDPVAAGWTFVDSDGDGYNWGYHVNTGSGNHTTHSGDGLIYSESWSSSALTPDNWAISPALDLSGVDSAVLSLWAAAQDSSYPDEHYALYAGTSADPASMTMISDELVATGTYENKTADLSDFVGEEEVYVAIRHFNCTDMFILNIDDVEIVIPDDAGFAACEEMGTRSGIVTAAAVNTRASDNAAYSWSFETADELGEWSAIDADGDGNNWEYYQDDPDDDYDNQAYDGTCDLVSLSYVNGSGPLTPDNWLISPTFDLSELEAATLSFYAKGRDPSYAAEHFAAYVCVGEPTSTADFVELLPEQVATGEWTQYTADLTEYLGEEDVCIAIRHFNVTDMFILDVDLVEILTGEAPEPVDPEPVEPGEADEIEATLVGTMGAANYSNGGSLAWDHNEDILYLAGNNSGTQDIDNILWVVDVETGAATRANEVAGTGSGANNASARLAGAVRGLFIVPDESAIVQPADEPTGIEVIPDHLNMLKGQVAELEAIVLPWTLSDKDVTWTSADESVATVKDGIVTAVDEGETVITVASVVNPEIAAEVTVTVTLPPSVEIRGIIWDEDGKGQASVFNSNATSEWEALAVVGQLRWGAHVGETVYGSTDDTMYAFDADTYEVTQLGGIVSMWIPSDADELPQDFRDAFAEMGYNVGPVIGPNNNGTYLTMLDPEAGSLIYFNLGDTIFGSDPMATFSYVGRGFYDDGESTDDNAAVFYGLTESGELYAFTMNHSGSIMWNDMGNTGLDLTGVADATNSVWASTVYDVESEFLFLAMYNGADEFAHLYAIDTNDLSRVGETGNFNADVWPVTGLYQYEPATDLMMKVDPTELVLFEGQTAEINVKIKLGETNKYTAEVADPAICSFEDGVVTGLKEGETTITITTVDVNEAGEHLTETVNVKVKGLRVVEGFVTAQVTDANGSRFTKISLDGAIASKKGVASDGNVLSGGRAGRLYIADYDATMPAVLNAETYDPNTEWNAFNASLYPSYSALDFTNYPTHLLENGRLNEVKALFVTENGYLLDPTISGWSLSSFMPGAVAVAFGGMQETDGVDGETVQIYDYYILGSDGILYYVGIDFVGGSRTDVQPIIDTGIVAQNPGDMSMTFLITSQVEGDESMDYAEAGLVIADNGTKNIWYLDFMAEDEADVVNLIGTLDAENVAGLAGTYDALDSVVDQQDIEPWTPPEGLINGWYFESASDVVGWTMLDLDGDGNTFAVNTSSSYPYEGTGALQSRWNSSTSVDNWAITPAIDLSDVTGANFSFYVRQGSSTWEENYAVYAGTTPNPDEMVELLPETAATSEYVNQIVSLDDFAGEPEVYVAIRHFDAVDQYNLYVDQVEVFEAKAETEPFEDVLWDFEDESKDGDWTIVDVDGDSSFQITQTNNAYSGSRALFCYYGDHPNDWAISPAVDLTNAEHPEVSVYGRKYGGSSWYEYFGIYAGTSTDIDEMTQVLASTELTSTYEEYVADLSAFAGEPEVYVAVRYYNSPDQFGVYFDDVAVREHADTGDAFAAVPMKAIEKREAKTMDVGFGRLDAVLDATTEMTKFGETGKAAVGGTNAIKAETIKTDLRKITDATTVEDGTVSIVLTEDEAVTNGLFTVTYNADVLTYVDAVSALPYKAISHVINEPAEGDEPALRTGVITFAYASVDEIPAETALLTLNFTYAADALETTVVVATAERNEKDGLDESEVIEIELGHDCPCAMFTDMPDYPSDEHSAIDWAYTHDPQITKGTSKTKFSPNKTVTRAQAATFLWRAAGCPTPKTTVNPFTDVVEGEYYYEAVLWAVEEGITTGTSKTKFSPAKTCSIEQIITFLYRFEHEPDVTGLENPYTDAADGFYSTNPLIWAYHNGIYTGKTETESGRTDGCTRAQIVTFLWRDIAPKEAGE